MEISMNELRTLFRECAISSKITVSDDELLRTYKEIPRHFSHWETSQNTYYPLQLFYEYDPYKDILTETTLSVDLLSSFSRHMTMFIPFANMMLAETPYKFVKKLVITNKNVKQNVLSKMKQEYIFNIQHAFMNIYNSKISTDDNNDPSRLRAGMGGVAFNH